MALQVTNFSHNTGLARDLLSHASAVEAGITPKDAREDPLDFLRYVMQDESGLPLQADHTTRLYVDLWEHCRAHRRHFAFISPPGMGKTTLALGCFARRIGEDPRLRTAIITADLQDTINSVSLVRSLVLSDHFKDVYPNAKPDLAKSMDGRGWRREAFFMQAAGHRKDATMSAHAFKPKKEAIRVDEGLMDDVITEANCDGQLLENDCKRFNVTWKDGRFAPRGWMCYHQNIRRLNDLAHRLREDPSFCSVWLGVNADRRSMFCYVWNPPPSFPLQMFPRRYKTVEMQPPTKSPAPELAFQLPLPDREGWSYEDMLGKSPSSFRQLYALQGVSSEDVMIKSWGKRKLFSGRAYELAGITQDEYGWPVMDHLARMRFAIVGAIDWSSTKRPGTCLWIILKDAKGEIYPLFLIKGRFGLKQMNEHLRHLWKNGVWVQRVGVETNGVQDTLLESMKDTDSGITEPWYSALASWNTGSNKWDPELGLPGIDMYFENEKVNWPVQEARAQTQFNGHWNEFELNIETMTRQDAKDRPPDDIMAFWIAMEAARNFGPRTAEQLKASTVALRSKTDGELDERPMQQRQAPFVKQIESARIRDKKRRREEDI